MNIGSPPARFNKEIAASGETRTVPDNSQIGIVNGAASLTDGFPPLNRTPVGSGGVPPSIRDMNEFLRRISALLRWISAGGGFKHNSTYVSNISGYPKGAKVLGSSDVSYWLNTADANTTDPEASGSVGNGWIPLQEAGVVTIDVTGISSNITLQPWQYAAKTIEFIGDLTANIDIIFPASAGQFVTEWTLINDLNTTSFKLRAVAGTGIYTYLNCEITKVSNYAGITMLSEQGAIPKPSNGLTPVTLITTNSAPALIMVTNTTGSDYWLVMLHDTGSAVNVNVISSTVTTANGETFTADRNPYVLKIAVSSGAESYQAKLVQNMR